jgi:hypothetical protein
MYGLFLRLSDFEIWLQSSHLNSAFILWGLSKNRFVCYNSKNNQERKLSDFCP